MKLKQSLTLAGILALSAPFAIGGKAKFSGIYSGKISTGFKVLAAVTKGGRVLGLDDDAEGLSDALNPASSTVSSAGTFKGSTPNGTSIVAKISSSYKLAGTAKNGGRTARISAKRIYK